MLAYAGICCARQRREISFLFLYFLFFFFNSFWGGLCRHLVCKTAAREVLAPGHIKMVAEEGILSLLALLVHQYKY